MGDDTLFVVTDRDERGRFVELHDCGARSATQQFGHSAMLLCGCVRRSRSSGGWCDAQRIGGRYACRTGATAVAELGGVAPCCSRSGISSDAEAVYLVLAQRGAATTDHLAETSTTYDADELRRHLRELVDLGLAADLGSEGWRALPLARRCPHPARAARGRAPAPPRQRPSPCRTICSRQPATSPTTTTSPCSSAPMRSSPPGTGSARTPRRRSASSTSPRTSTIAPPPRVETLSASSPEWQALERGIVMRCVYHPGFDSDRLAELSSLRRSG